MDEPPPPLDEKALETRRERTIGLFKARMARWPPVQGAAFAVVTVALVAHLGEWYGDPPLRAREARAELAELRRRLKARQEAWDARERAAWP